MEAKKWDARRMRLVERGYLANGSAERQRQRQRDNPVCGSATDEVEPGAKGKHHAGQRVQVRLDMFENLECQLPVCPIAIQRQH